MSVTQLTHHRIFSIFSTPSLGHSVLQLFSSSQLHPPAPTSPSTPSRTRLSIEYQRQAQRPELTLSADVADSGPLHVDQHIRPHSRSVLRSTSGRSVWNIGSTFVQLGQLVWCPLY